MRWTRRLFCMLTHLRTWPLPYCLRTGHPAPLAAGRWLHGPVMASPLLQHSVVTVSNFSILFFFGLSGMWDLSSLTSDRTCSPCSGSMES